MHFDAKSLPVDAFTRTLLALGWEGHNKQKNTSLWRRSQND